MKNKIFNWEGYNKGRQEYRFEDLTEEELKEWAKNWGFKIKKIKGKVYLRGKNGFCFAKIKTPRNRI